MLSQVLPQEAFRPQKHRKSCLDHGMQYDDISKFLISGSNFLVSDWLMLSLMAFLMSFYLWSVRAGTASSKAWVRSAHWWQIVTTITTMIAVKPLFSTCLCENKSQGNCENTTAILFHLLIIFSIDELPRLTKLGITDSVIFKNYLIDWSFHRYPANEKITKND